MGKLTAEEKRDLERYPNMMRFIKTFPNPKIEALPAGNEHLTKSLKIMQVVKPTWDEFFACAIKDRLTNLRAFALAAREFKSRGITVFGPGRYFEDSVRMNNIDLGLSLPATHIGLGIWEPDSSVKDPEFLLHLRVVYNERYIHKFPDEVLPANLKIGYGDETDYAVDGKKYHGYLLTSDLYMGPNGVGFKNVKGVGGQKRGLLGFFQKVLFFLPDAVHSMVINEKENTLVTEALINTVVNEFETREIYRIRYKN
jgi:hypothetical protein